MRSQLRHVVLASLAVAPLLLASSAHAASTKGYLRVEGLKGPVKEQGHANWFDMTNHEIEFGDDGTCDVHVQALLDGAALPLAHVLRLDETVAEIEIELTHSSHGVETYYSATLTNVRLAKVTSRSVWGGAFDELELRPATVHIEQRRQKADGSFEVSGQLTETCGSVRVP